MLSVFLRFLRFRELFIMRFVSFFFLVLIFIGSSSCYESIGNEFEVSQKYLKGVCAESDHVRVVLFESGDFNVEVFGSPSGVIRRSRSR